MNDRSLGELIEDDGTKNFYPRLKNTANKNLDF